MGFPLHRGTVDNGLLTCHWHHARFDLASGGTLDPFADDVKAHTVELDGTDVYVALRIESDAASHQVRRLEEGLEQGLTLVIAKAVLALVELLGPEEGTTEAVRVGVGFGIRNREAGWGAGLTVLTAMANIIPDLSPSDRVLALVHGLAFVSSDTRGRPPRFALAPLPGEIPVDRLAEWYRRFLDTRNGDAAERVLATASATGPAGLARLMGVGITDHVFVDGGHSVDFTNKALEVLDQLGSDWAQTVSTSLAGQSARASRSEETGQWRHPYDLPGLLTGVQAGGVESPGDGTFGDDEVDSLAWTVLGDDPAQIVEALDTAVARGATYEQAARAVAYAAALRMVRFHTRNDHGDWDVVHHGFTAANAVHQLIRRVPDPYLARGIYQGAMKVFLDRFLNIPAARLPGASRSNTGGAPSARPDLEQLQECWDQEGQVDDAGGIVYGWLMSGGDQESVVAALGSALLAEDAEFHWYQTFEAAVRQAAAWPRGSQQSALILAGAARFLAAHTPTRRELAQVFRIAARLRRGEALYEEIE
jgi:hypothetical protein